MLSKNSKFPLIEGDRVQTSFLFEKLSLDTCLGGNLYGITSTGKSVDSDLLSQWFMVKIDIIVERALECESTKLNIDSIITHVTLDG